MKIYRGSVVTCDEKESVFSYLVEDNGKIVHTGSDLPPQYRGGTVTDLGDKALLPGFGDGHLHFSNWALFNATFDVREASDFNGLAEIINGYAGRDRKSKVLLGFGLSRHILREERLITREELDRITSRPVYIVSYDGHSAVTNSSGIALFPEQIRREHGFDPERGHIYYEAFYKATDFISGTFSAPFLIKAILRGTDTLAAAGITLAHPVEGVGFPRDMDVDLVKFLAKGSGVAFRIYFQTTRVEKVLKRKLPRIGGCFATALDGCFGAKDAALLDPYTDEPENRGILFHQPGPLRHFVRTAHDAGLQIQLHAIGDAAVKLGTEALEAAIRGNPRRDHRHTLIHACLIPQETMEKIASLEIGITLQPPVLTSPLEPSRYLEKILGGRAADISPLRKMTDMGIPLSGGSDAPVTPPDPIAGIHAACNYRIPEQSLTLQEALRLYTYNVARTSFDEKERGSLEPGKRADMTVLNRNPFSLPKEELKDLKVLETYVSGKPYRPKKLAGTSLKSIFNPAAY
ncbi:MAG: amidohydrolase [Spirochaetia bacterium]